MTTTPQTLRDAGIEATTNAADPRLILAIDACIAHANSSGERWSANDIRDKLPVVAAPLVGARVCAAAARRPREMTRVGYTASSLLSTRNHPIAVWLGTQSPQPAPDGS